MARSSFVLLVCALQTAVARNVVRTMSLEGSENIEAHRADVFIDKQVAHSMDYKVDRKFIEDVYSIEKKNGKVTHYHDLDEYAIKHMPTVMLKSYKDRDHYHAVVTVPYEEKDGHIIDAIYVRNEKGMILGGSVCEGFSSENPHKCAWVLDPNENHFIIEVKIPTTTEKVTAYVSSNKHGSFHGPPLKIPRHREEL